MQTAQLQPRPLYGIGTVARLTGVKPDTLRVWERRYQLGASHKSDSGRRQYTQADLEHLQLVAALVASGTRIGEIASSRRRTLEMLVRARGSHMEASIPAAKPRVLFIGDGLCDWLEEHQGCLVNCNALLACTSLANFDAGLLDPGAELDAVVVECSGSAAASLAALAQLTEVLGTSNIVALHRFGNERWVRELEQRGYRTGSFPPDPALLAFILTRRAAEAAASPGSGSLGELVEGRPRLFSEQELSEARKLEENVACECPRHITDLVRALAMFEDYSATCSVENWQDASLHACIYAYTGQARWLMEKALGLAVDSHREESAIA